MKMFLASGVPHSVQMDGWWLKGNRPPPLRPQAFASDSPLLPLRAGALVALVAISDRLLWQVSPGLSLAVFGMALLGVAWALTGARGTPGLALAVLLFLPVVERVQALSVAFWLAGLVLGAGWIALARWPGLSGGLRFLAHAPGRVVSDLARARREGLPDDLGVFLQRGFRGWFLPVGLGLVFLSLLVEANPILEAWATALVGWEPGIAPGRIMFWLGAATIIWPFLTLPRMEQRIALGFSAPRFAFAFPMFVNAASVRRSLVLFNIVFAAQTLSDLAILAGDADLPAGVSYATYAHRGAYPLLVTALLAGAFALIARPLTRGNTALRAALLGWMGQTLALVMSSLFRLESYVAAYGLTHLRLAALIWMALVAAGIVLVIWQILRDRSAWWLLRSCAGMGAVTLYVCGFVSFASVVADYNLTHDAPNDRFYLCGLDRAAWPVIRAHEMATGTRLCPERRLAVSTDWREWGFRDWRTARSLATIETRARTAEGAGPQWPTF